MITAFDHSFYVKGKSFIPATYLWIGAEILDNKGNIFEI
ncbi:MAG: hypothetical protein GX905_02475 [Bacteroidales bacterium]|nr:hypothetical protein [Bacteroidales bacterium]